MWIRDERTGELVEDYPSVLDPSKEGAGGSSIIERLDDIENALIELAGIIAEGE